MIAACEEKNWTVRGRRAVAFLERMLPNLFVKQDEAEAAIRFYRRAVWTPGRPVTEEEYARREKYAQILREMKKGDEDHD